MNRKKPVFKRPQKKERLTEPERVKLARRLSEVSKSEVREVLYMSEAFRELRRQLLARHAKDQAVAARAK